MGDEDDVHGKQYRTSRQREPRSVDGLVYEFVPEGEVEVYAHHYFCGHHYGDDAQSLPVVAAHHVFEQGQVCHHAQESQQGEDKEILHAYGVGLVLVLVLALREDKGFVGIAEGLCYHGHDHCHLHASTVYAQFHHSLCGVGIDEGEYHLVCCLVEYAGNAKYQHGPRVGQHAPEQTEVHLPLYP